MQSTMMQQGLIVLGSTGSIGTQALDVAEHLKIPVEAICAGRDVDTVLQQARRHRVKFCAMGDERAAAELRLQLRDTDIAVLSGADGISEMIRRSKAPLVLNAIVGQAGLAQTMATLDAGKQLALANKESLVVAGDIVMSSAKKKGIAIRPVDSEHCAIAQCLQGHRADEVQKLILTASGGPFFGKKGDQIKDMRAEDALAHPTWSMGAKITVDSATMMNKGFEIIEACHLFGVSEQRVDVVVHRESIIHSMVEYIDHSILAQLAVPDMRLCIQNAITHPYRLQSQLKPLDLPAIGKLSFYEPDDETFVLLRRARECIAIGGALPAVLNAANEIAVSAFLSNKIRFGDIADTVEHTLSVLTDASGGKTLDEILAYDGMARRTANDYIAQRFV